MATLAWQMAQGGRGDPGFDDDDDVGVDIALAPGYYFVLIL